MLAPTDETVLWEAAARGDAQARERLIENYLPFSRILAAKLYRGRIDLDQEFCEYFQFAAVGLIEAVDRYDLGRGVLFKSFAAHRIHGAVMNGLAHLSEKREQISARKRLLDERRDSGKIALEQTDKDVFQQLAEVAVGLALGYLLDDQTSHVGEDAFVAENQYSGLELRQLQTTIRALVENLPQREKLIIKYHYLHQMPFHVIANILGVTKGRVSQNHRQALELLRHHVNAVKTCDLAW
ncbi:MAG: sigma-70 family RNA polymerase sigma factor [Pseudomonadota bacterium]